MTANPAKGRLVGKQKELFNFIVQYKTDHDGLSPSLREIISNTSFKSTSHVTANLIKLENLGVITNDSRFRGIQVVEGKWSYTGDAN